MNPESAMDVGRLDILRNSVQNRVTDLQMIEVEVVIRTAEVMGNLEPLHHNMVGATDR